MMWIHVISTMDQWWINDGSMVHQRCINENIQCVTYKKIALLPVLNRVWEQGWNCMDTLNVTLRILKLLFNSQVLWPSNYFLSWIRGWRSYQWWINNVSLALPLPPLAAPDDFLLELAPPPLRKIDPVCLRVSALMYSLREHSPTVMHPWYQHKKIRVCFSLRVSLRLSLRCNGLCF